MKVFGLNLGGNGTYGYIQGIRGAGNTLSYNDIVLQPNGGNLNIGGTSSYKFSVSSAASDWTSYFYCTGVTPAGVRVSYSSAPNGAGSQFFYGSDSSGLRLEIRSNGGVGNYQANDVNFSDKRMKKDIQLAAGYLDKICAIPIVTYLYNDQTDGELNLGVLAQDVDAVAPELVCHDGFGGSEENKESPLLSIYQADMLFAVMKALQELKAEFDIYKTTHP